MTRTRTALLGGLIVALTASAGFGQGMMVPTERTLPPLTIKSQQVQINIENQVATTIVKQVFSNSTGRALEAAYVFPLPPDATIRDFALVIDGKRVSGELVEAAKAKQIYTQIVAQSRDPGLLEHLGDNLYRVSAFPVPANATQSVELTYSQLVPGNGGVFRYVYPLHTAGKASQVQDFFSIGAKLISKTPIMTVYSPSHQIGVSRKGDNEATVGLEQSRVFLDKDFALYWTISDKDFGLNAVTYRPKADQPGYLMLLLSPKSAVNENEVIAKDVIFVFDTSGSMGGDKIEQAKKALKFCVEALNERDRFNIITFSTDVTPYKESLIEASKANKEAVREFINKLQAEGGTNIYEALETALKLTKPGEGKDSARPKVIVFMTDGRPTINKTGSEEILGLLGKDGIELSDTGRKTARIFTFGVGDDVNTKLLDRIAQVSGGQPEYVRPAEDIEVKVSDFFSKASHPVMTGLKLAFGGDVKVEQMFPTALPDLYFGQQVIAFARYSGSGDVSVSLSGTVSTGKTEKHTYEVNLPKQTTDNDFIEALWAHRKVGYLLDQIRLNGENKELKDEVISLSKRYKIQTPYTSYLVLEEQQKRQYLGGEKTAGYWGSGNNRIGGGGGSGGGSGDGSGVGSAGRTLTINGGISNDTGVTPGAAPRSAAEARDEHGRQASKEATDPAAARRPVDPKPSADRPDLAPPPEMMVTPAKPGEDVASKVGPAGEKGPVGPQGPTGSATGTPTVAAPEPADKSKPMTESEKKDLDRLHQAMNDSLVKAGAGKTTLDGTVGGYFYAPPSTQPGNSYAGGVAVSGGTLRTGGKLQAGDSRGDGKDREKDARVGLDEKSLKAESGEVAVALAKEISDMKKADSAAGERADRTSRKAGDRTFYNVAGFWIDEKFDVPIRMTFVKWGSEAYFAIVTAHVELKDSFALGTRVILVTANGKALVVSETDGVDKLTDQEVKDLFTAAVAAPAAPAKPDGK